jgi:hypothetical protein
VNQSVTGTTDSNLPLFTVFNDSVDESVPVFFSPVPDSMTQVFYLTTLSVAKIIW